MRFPGVIPAVTTPFDAHGEVDLDALRGNARSLLDAGLTGIVGNGTMGEAGSLSAAERRRTIAALVDRPPGRATGAAPSGRSATPPRAGRRSPPASPPPILRPRSPTPVTPPRPERAP